MKNCTRFIALLLTTVSATAFANTRWAIETDPYTFVQQGDALHLKVALEQLPNWRFGIGTYSLQLPSMMVELNSENDGQDWEVDLERGIGLFTDYYFNPQQTGLYLGMQLAQQDFHVEAKHHQADFTNQLVMLNIGYRLPLFNTAWYIQPWTGVGHTHTSSGKSQRLAAGYDVDPWVGFVTLHLGYQF